MNLNIAGSSDILFYHDSIDVRTQVEADITLMLCQPKFSMFYNRQYGSEVPLDENIPNSSTAQIKLRADVVKAFALRNKRVTSGVGGTVDRRAWTSQSVIWIDQDPSNGEVDLAVQYILSSDLTQMQSVKVGGGK